MAGKATAKNKAAWTILSRYGSGKGLPGIDGISKSAATTNAMTPETAHPILAFRVKCSLQFRTLLSRTGPPRSS